MKRLLCHLLDILANTPLLLNTPLYATYKVAYRSTELENCDCEMLFYFAKERVKEYKQYPISIDFYYTYIKSLEIIIEEECENCLIGN